MTPREQAAEQLMAALTGEMPVELVLTESGDVMSGEALEEDDGPTCHLCDAWLDDDCPVIDGYTLCDNCMPEYHTLRRLQVTCPVCRGKCLVRSPAAWQPCDCCGGHGWIGGVIARVWGLL